MIDTTELIESINKLKSKDEETGNRVGTVVGLFESGAAQIQFDGEDTPSEKEFPYLKSYVPTLNDEVFIQRHAGDYIIIDAIYNNGKSPHQIDLNNVKGNFKVDGSITSTGDIKTDANISSKIIEVQEDLTVKRNLSVDGEIENKVLTEKLESINKSVNEKITSAMTTDVNGNQNIDYMYVNPYTGDLTVRRKNGQWTTYQMKT